MPRTDGSVCGACGRAGEDAFGRTFTEDTALYTGASCKHILCGGCIDRAYNRARANKSRAQCPVQHCARDLPRMKDAIKKRAVQLNEQTPEDQEHAKEISIRKSLKKIFTKDIEYFRRTCESEQDAKRAYNDYVEMVETYILNLVKGENVEATEQAIEKERENMVEIPEPQTGASQPQEGAYQQQKIVGGKRTREQATAGSPKSPKKSSIHLDSGPRLLDRGPIAPQAKDPEVKRGRQRRIRASIYKQRIASGFDVEVCISKQVEEAVTTLYL